MCGRVYIRSSLRELLANFAFAGPGDVEPLSNSFPRYNGAPQQDYPIIVRQIVQEPDLRQYSAFRRQRACKVRLD